MSEDDELSSFGVIESQFHFEWFIHICESACKERVKEKVHTQYPTQPFLLSRLSLCEFIIGCTYQ